MTLIDVHREQRGASDLIDKLEEAVRTGACFGRSDFQAEDLRHARLPNIDLRGSRLSTARLDGAVLAGACFRAADMRGISLVGADLRRAGLREANLVDADLRDADLREANLLDADLTGAKLAGSKIDGAAFNAVSLRNADLAGARFGDARLLGRCPLIQIAGVGRAQATLTAYRTAQGCKIVVDERLCEEPDLRAVLSADPHRCGDQEIAAIAGLVCAHQARPE